MIQIVLESLSRVATNLEISGNLKTCQNLRENSEKSEFLLKKPGKSDQGK